MRHKSSAGIVLAAGMALILGLLTVPAVQAGVASSPGTCTGPLGPITVSGNLIVPPGATCTLTGTTVKGNVVVQQGGSLLTQGGVKIGGNLQATGANLLQINDATITGSVSISGTATQSIPDPGTPGGREFPKNTICNSTIGGSLSLTNSNANSVFVVGDLPPDDNCNGANTIRGSVSMSGNNASTQLSNNQITGSVSFVNNGLGSTGEVEFDLGGNTIGGSLACSGNVPPPDPAALFFEPNTVRGSTTGQCVPPTSPPPNVDSPIRSR